MNSEKTKFIIFTTKNNNDHVFDRLFVDEEEYNRVDSFELLGMSIDMDINFEKHIQKIKNKIVPTIALIGRLKRYVNETVLKNIYYSYINSHLMYMLQIYSAATKGRLDKLYKLQKKVIKYIYNFSRRHPTESLFNNDILSLPAMVKYQSALTIYKIKKTNNEISNQLISFSVDTGRSMRSTNYITSSIFPRLEVIKRSFFHAGANMFNELPRETREVATIEQFKEKAKYHFKSTVSFEESNYPN